MAAPRHVRDDAVGAVEWVASAGAQVRDRVPAMTLDGKRSSDAASVDGQFRSPTDSFFRSPRQ
ncbi:hypothetical protein [Amycolatopsis sp. cmx-11-32]|uniref:hypothetical protein n=1 Tax=Amycolatopsis sp. cmx-11-32 TaxID=2785796 RepID=UPI0039E52679